MKRNRGGEQDLDHIISAAIRGMDRAKLEYPVTPGLIFCLDRAFPYQLNEIIAEKAIAYLGRGVVGIDIAGPESHDFRPRDYRRLFDRCRRAGLGITVHAGEAGPVEEIADVIENLEPSRIGHGVKAAYDPRTMDMIRERGMVLEVCPTSNLNTRVVASWDEFRWIFDTFRRHGVRYTINTDGPEMLRTYIRDELATLGRLGILSLEEQEQSAEWARQASFVPGRQRRAATAPPPRSAAAGRTRRGLRAGRRPGPRAASRGRPFAGPRARRPPRPVVTRSEQSSPEAARERVASRTRRLLVTHSERTGRIAGPGDHRGRLRGLRVHWQ